jgi:hypothetical protein
MGKEPVPETYLNELTRLIAREDYIEPRATFSVSGTVYILTGKQHSAITEVNYNQQYTRCSAQFSFKPTTYTEKYLCSKISE